MKVKEYSISDAAYIQTRCWGRIRSNDTALGKLHYCYPTGCHWEALQASRIYPCRSPKEWANAAARGGCATLCLRRLSVRATPLLPAGQYRKSKCFKITRALKVNSYFASSRARASGRSMNWPLDKIRNSTRISLADVLQ